MDFDAKIPLWPGSNAITIVARENDQVRSSHTLFMYRDSSQTTAVAPKEPKQSK
jgi:hypothetical protein